MKIDFYRHALGEAEVQEVTAALRSTFITTASRTAAFEERFAARQGVPHAVGTSSCTTALFLSLRALDIGPGDEVIVPAMTYIATASAAWWCGARVVLADVEPGTGLIDPEDVARRITDKTRAVIPVHIYGALADMHALAALCRPRGIALVEDAAHCVEGRRDGYGPGAIGDTACFSFYATKNLTSGEGGAVICRDDRLATRLRRLRLLGVSRSAAERHAEDTYVHWDLVELGYKCNMYDLQAAVLLPQLARIDERRERREALSRRYDSAIAGVPDAHPCPVPSGCTSARHLYTCHVPGERRDRLLQHLTASGVGCAVNYRALTELRWVQEKLGTSPDATPVATSIGRRTLSLPLYPDLREEEVDRVVEVLAEGLRRAPTRDEPGPSAG